MMDVEESVNEEEAKVDANLSEQKIEVDEKMPMLAEKNHDRPPPLHATRVIYLPYLPLSVHRATVESVSSYYFYSYQLLRLSEFNIYF